MVVPKVARALMEDDQKQRPESLLPYEKWIEQALRHVGAQAMEHCAAEGLPGGHHFYITFRTGHPGVELPQRIRAQYPQEMTIVLQHQFWDLGFDHDSHTIQVGLSFGGVPSKLVISLDAVLEFAAPHITSGLRFQTAEPPPPQPPPDKPGQPEDTAPESTDPKDAEPAQ